MKLAVLPSRSASAAENMAMDFLLLQRYPENGVARLRSYGWRRPAFTFGYAQKIVHVRAQLQAIAPDSDGIDLCRRPTGGGIVDHREDWTYSLVIPRGHPWEEARALESYRGVHEALAEALRRQDVSAALKAVDASVGEKTENLAPDVPPKSTTMEGVCFGRAETFDVIDASSGLKIAGAAQKRTKRGLLFQGSIWRPAVGRALDWDRFEAEFVSILAEAMAIPAERAPWPEFNEDEVSGLAEQYASSEWIEYR
jgi:lipoate-protein ligase A